MHMIMIFFRIFVNSIMTRTQMFVRDQFLESRAKHNVVFLCHFSEHPTRLYAAVPVFRTRPEKLSERSIPIYDIKKAEGMIEFREFSSWMKKKTKRQNWRVHAYSREIVTNSTDLELIYVYLRLFTHRKLQYSQNIAEWSWESWEAGKRRLVQNRKE